jgi:hypothetical protein
MLQITNKTINHTKVVANIHRYLGDRSGKTNGVAIALAVVVNVTVAFAACVPSSVTELGETVHVAPAGVPRQLQVTVWVDPFAGVAETV